MDIDALGSFDIPDDFLFVLECCLLVGAFDEDALDVVDVIVVVVIDNELLNTFCGRPSSGLLFLALGVDMPYIDLSFSKYCFS